MSDKSMVQCLADLNGCSFIEMRNELMRLNIISEKDRNILNKKATKWSNSEIQEMVRLAELGYESEKIAEIIGRSCSSTRSKLYECGISLNKIRKENSE